MTADITGTVDEYPTPFDSDLDRRAVAYRRLRAEGPVVPMPGLEGALAAVSYDAVYTGRTGSRELHRDGDVALLHDR